MKITINDQAFEKSFSNCKQLSALLLTIVALLTENFEIINKIKHRKFPSTDYLKFEESHPEVGDASSPWVKPWHLHAVAVIIPVNGRESK